MRHALVGWRAEPQVGTILPRRLSPALHRLDAIIRQLAGHPPWPDRCIRAARSSDQPYNVWRMLRHHRSTPKSASKKLVPAPLGGQHNHRITSRTGSRSGGVWRVRGVVLHSGEHGQRNPPRTEGPCLPLATGSRAKRVQWSGWERVEKPPNPVGVFGNALE